MTHHRSFGLATLVSEMINTGDRILDLGPMSSGTTEAFLKRNCQCHIEDLVEYLSDNQGSHDPLEALEQHLIPKPKSLKYDVILCWDILNFLSLEVIEHLMNLLAPHLKQGTILHTMRYTGSNQPNKPRRFRLGDDFCYEYIEDDSYPQVASKGHSTVTLLKRMHRFSLFNSLMKREGMDKNVTEHFLEYDSQTSRKQIRSGGASDISRYFTTASNAQPIELEGFKTVLAELPEQSLMLECGPKNGRNLEFLQRHVGALYTEDLFSSMAWRQKNLDCQALSESLLVFDGSRGFDAVLLWNLLDFCLPEQIQQLGILFKEKMTPEAKLHLLMVKSSGLPQKPPQFDVVNDSYVKIHGELSGSISNVSLSTTDLLRLLPDYKIASHHFGRLPSGESYLEFILQLKPLS